MAHTHYFKECPDCGHVWDTREDFLADTQLELIGYRADLVDLIGGRLFAVHKVPGCFSTLTVSLAAFWDLQRGAGHSERLEGDEQCPGHCRDVSDLATCDNPCDCAHAREIVQEVLTLARRIKTPR